MCIFLLLTSDTPLKTENLNEIAKTMALPIQFNSNIDLGTHSGFLPATVNGVKQAVETLKLAFSEVALLLPANKDINPEDTVVIQFRWGGDPNEKLIALYTAMLYTSSYDGIVFDSKLNKYLNTEQLKQSIESLLKPA